MAVGLVCFWLDPETEVNLTPSKQLSKKKWETGGYTTQQIYDLYLENLRVKSDAIDCCIAYDVKLYRWSSSLLPLWEKIEHDSSLDQLVSQKLREIGKKIKDNNLRINFHPDHFCVLATEKEHVFQNSILELQNHVYLLEQMELDESSFYNINIHAGGKDKTELAIRNIKRLPSSIRNRISLENDEFCYNVEELYKIYQETGVPIVFDSHHYEFNPGSLTLEESLDLAITTWGDIKPTTHSSNSKPGLSSKDSVTRRRAHAEYVEIVPEYQVQLCREEKIDIEIEAKKKSLAYFRVREKYALS